MDRQTRSGAPPPSSAAGQLDGEHQQRPIPRWLAGNVHTGSPSTSPSPPKSVLSVATVTSGGTAGGLAASSSNQLSPPAFGTAFRGPRGPIHFHGTVTGDVNIVFADLAVDTALGRRHDSRLAQPPPGLLGDHGDEGRNDKSRPAQGQSATVGSPSASPTPGSRRVYERESHQPAPRRPQLVFGASDNIFAAQEPKSGQASPLTSPVSSRSSDQGVFTPSESEQGTPFPTPFSDRSSRTDILAPMLSDTASLPGGPNPAPSGRTSAGAPGPTTTAGLSPLFAARSTRPAHARNPSRVGTPVPRYEVAAHEELAGGWDEQRNLAPIRQVLADLAAALCMAGRGSNPALKGLEDEARRLQAFDWPKAWRVGLVGDSGDGKSSLVNALLDLKGLARTGSGGSACTTVVTEYHSRREAQLPIKVVPFSDDEIRIQLRELVVAYRFFHSSSNDLLKEANDSKIKAQVAEMTLGAMLGFTSFGSLLHGEVEQVLEDLSAKVDKARAANPRLSWNPEVQDFDMLKQQLLKLTSVSDPDEPGGARWPWIKRVEVYLDSDILRNGLVLVDLPGLRDSNSARCKMTERYLMKECDQIFAVCDIKRVVDNMAVEDVFRLGRQAQLASIGIICTKSDDINPEEALAEAQANDRTAAESELKSMQSVLDKLDRDVDSMNRAIGEYGDFDSLGWEELLEKSRLESNARSANKRRRRHILRRHSYLVNNRNMSITARLRDKFTASVREAGGQALQVFCVSNTDYWDSGTLPLEDPRPHIQLSGIPSLRRHCSSVGTRAQLRAAEAYVSGSVPALLASVDLWVRQQGPAVDEDEKVQLLNNLARVQAILNAGFESENFSRGSLQGRMTEIFDEQIYNKRNCQHWAQNVSQKVLGWSQWHHATYAAFCRQYGAYSSTKIGKPAFRDWNNEVLEPLRNKIVMLWDGPMADGLAAVREALGFDVGDCLDNALQTLAEAAGTGGISGGKADGKLQPLRSVLKHKNQRLRSDLAQIWGEFEVEYRKLRADVVSGHRTSIIGELTEPTYMACNSEYGQGSDRRRKDAIEKKMLSGGFEELSGALFEGICSEFRDRFGRLAGETADKIQAAARIYLNDVRRDLELARGDRSMMHRVEDEGSAVLGERVQAAVVRVEERAALAKEAILHAEMRLERVEVNAGGSFV